MLSLGVNKYEVLAANATRAAEMEVEKRRRHKEFKAKLDQDQSTIIPQDRRPHPRTVIAAALMPIEKTSFEIGKGYNSTQTQGSGTDEEAQYLKRRRDQLTYRDQLDADRLLPPIEVTRAAFRHRAYTPYAKRQQQGEDDEGGLEDDSTYRKHLLRQEVINKRHEEVIAKLSNSNSPSKLLEKQLVGGRSQLVKTPSLGKEGDIFAIGLDVVHACEKKRGEEKEYQSLLKADKYGKRSAVSRAGSRQARLRQPIEDHLSLTGNKLIIFMFLSLLLSLSLSNTL